MEKLARECLHFSSIVRLSTLGSDGYLVEEIDYSSQYRCRISAEMLADGPFS